MPNSNQSLKYTKKITLLYKFKKQSERFSDCKVFRYPDQWAKQYR